MAALFLLDQINKHRTPLNSERDNMNVLLSGHYALEKSSWKVLNTKCHSYYKIRYKL